MAGFPEIGRLLGGFGCAITYAPLRTEVPIDDVFGTAMPARTYRIPARAALDPEEIARTARAFADGATTAILIPGRRFDAVGTRHGQGGGWYDRFLAKVPREWLRIGFCFDDQFSPEPLPRESWDESMDYVVVVNRETGATTLYSSEGVHP